MPLKHAETLYVAHRSYSTSYVFSSAWREAACGSTGASDSASLAQFHLRGRAVQCVASQAWRCSKVSYGDDQNLRVHVSRMCACILCVHVSCECLQCWSSNKHASVHPSARWCVKGAGNQSSQSHCPSIPPTPLQHSPTCRWTVVPCSHIDRHHHCHWAQSQGRNGP